ncbi:uncharacterized protein LOC123552408 [Mercenaria mercenaria]|uniref:uncharacterized protein LOC123552408 n=1 Tax=Mercenaria mercenaria TaxID=6596 RepID=UPI00234E4676|nr:uncharacterized protein LOC123552408 [Mercenaria mercenaria]
MAFQLNRNRRQIAVLTILIIIYECNINIVSSSGIKHPTGGPTGTISTLRPIFSTNMLYHTKTDESSTSLLASSTAVSSLSRTKTQLTTPLNPFSRNPYSTKNTQRIYSQSNYLTTRIQHFSNTKKPFTNFKHFYTTSMEFETTPPGGWINMTYQTMRDTTSVPPVRKTTATEKTAFWTSSTPISPEHLIDSEYCKYKKTCGEFRGTYDSFPKKNCYCDLLCSTFNDCCDDFLPFANVTVKKNQFSCMLTDSVKSPNGEGVYMVTTCFDNWENDIIRSLCEGPDDDLLLKTPVTDTGEYRITYKNMYCAQCNFVYDFVYWKTDVQCKDDTNSALSGCTYKHEAPADVPPRECKPYIGSECWFAESEELVHNCTHRPFSLVYTNYGIYRNRYCAECDGFEEENMYCEMPPHALTTTPHPPFTTNGPVYSFRLLVDLNAVFESNMCGDSEIFDSVSKTCRQIYCAPPSSPRKGVCMMNTNEETTGVYANNSVEHNCTLVKLNSKEYKMLNNSKILLLSRQVILNEDEFRISGSDVFICLEKLGKCISDCDTLSVLFNHATGESYVSLIGLIVSISSLSITSLVYICFPQLLNIPGKNLTCLVISLLLAHLLFLLSSEAESIPTLCKLVAVLLHYLFLSSFCWMNIIAFDFCSTFSNNFASAVRDKNLKRFILYSVYGWLTPLIFVSVAVTLDLSELDSKYSSLKPGYGKGICWITSSNSLILFFAGPLSLLKLFDFIAFILTMIFIARSKRQCARATKKKDTCSFFINLKLSLIMGLTWVFAFVANIVKDKSIWYLFIVFNSLQGLFIAVCFLCSRRVFRLLCEKYRSVSSHFTNSSITTKSELYT